MDIVTRLLLDNAPREQLPLIISSLAGAEDSDEGVHYRYDQSLISEILQLALAKDISVQEARLENAILRVRKGLIEVLSLHFAKEGWDPEDPVHTTAFRKIFSEDLKGTFLEGAGGYSEFPSITAD